MKFKFLVFFLTLFTAVSKPVVINAVYENHIHSDLYGASVLDEVQYFIAVAAKTQYGKSFVVSLPLLTKKQEKSVFMSSKRKRMVKALYPAIKKLIAPYMGYTESRNGEGYWKYVELNHVSFGLFKIKGRAIKLHSKSNSSPNLELIYSNMPGRQVDNFF